MSERMIMDEAASWFLRVHETSANAETFLQWQRWLAVSPEHRSAFAQIEETSLRLARADAQTALPSAAEMAADAYDGSVPIAEFVAKRKPAIPESPRPSPSLTRSAGFRYAVAAALVAVTLIGGGLWLQAIHQSQHGVFAYSTAPGQRRVFALPEGSRITLDADSALNVQLTPGERSLRLARGEAYFEVSRDPARPFVVNAGGTRVRAVGTAFNVRMSERRTVVAVVEGKVEVTAPDASNSDSGVESRPEERRRNTDASAQRVTRVAAGQAIAYAEDGALRALPAAEASIATTWLDGRRQYLNEPLQYVLADANRYTSRQIEIADAATGELRFTGTLNLQNSDAWLRGLSIALPVTVTEKADGTLLVTLVERR